MHNVTEIKQALEKLIKEAGIQRIVKDVQDAGNLNYAVYFTDDTICNIKRKNIDDYIDSNGTHGKREIENIFRTVFIKAGWQK